MQRLTLYKRIFVQKYRRVLCSAVSSAALDILKVVYDVWLLGPSVL